MDDMTYYSDKNTVYARTHRADIVVAICTTEEGAAIIVMCLNDHDKMIELLRQQRNLLEKA